jgi:uncharacterized protein YndB with AHSA1/START domain
MTAASPSATGLNQEVRLTRVLDAPRELVFKVWTDPAHVQKWWAPKNFTNPRCEVDARVGGQMRIDMRAPDGTVYPMDAEFEQIVKPERIVFVTGALDAKGNRKFSVRNTVTFAEHGDRQTLLTLHARVIQIMVPEAAKHIGGMSAGWSQSLDKLADYVSANASADREIVSRRTFDYPPQRVFEAWTDPKQLNQWWGPKGFTTTFKSFDLRPGGEWNFVMHGPDGKDYQNRIIFQEIVPPQMLAFDHTSGPHFGVVTTFTDTGCGGTDVTFRMIFKSAEECDKVKPYAVEGNEQNFDKLQAHLARENA